jgi:hypothetical protein
MSLTRYDGWFLIPFAGLWFAFYSRHKLLVFALFGALAALAPAYWMAHNWWETGNALDFYNGPSSAAAIQGASTYPGDHDWKTALQYYSIACRLCAGPVLVALGALGIICAAVKRALAPIFFLLLPPAFYVWSIHSAKLPVRVPQFWGAYYNTRYALTAVPLAAFAAGAIILVLPRRAARYWFAIPLLAVVPWLIHPSQENWICWKESQVNSVSRRFWTNAAAQYLQKNYRTQQGILTSPGDVTGVFCRARIHLSETVSIYNGPFWFAATSRPDLFHPNIWAIAQDGDKLDQALAKAGNPVYVPRFEIQAKSDPILKISRRAVP